MSTIALDHPSLRGHLDLVPLVLAGEASAATRAPVDAHLARDPELAGRVRRLIDTGAAPQAATLPPALEHDTPGRMAARDARDAGASVAIRGDARAGGLLLVVYAVNRGRGRPPR